MMNSAVCTCLDLCLSNRDSRGPHRNKQHIAFVLGVGGLYPNAEIVRAVLAPQEGTQKKILDLGRLSLGVPDSH
jgi:hypothetical protein